MRPSAARAAFLLLPLIIATCTSPPPPRFSLAPVDFAALSGWPEDHVAAALPAFEKSCAALAKLPDDRSLGIGGAVSDWHAVCRAAAALGAADDATARRFFETRFTAYAVADTAAKDGLVTGYFEPELQGDRQPGARFATPLLRRPPDLVDVDLGRFRPAWHGERIAGRVVDGQLRPYDTRAAIEAGALDRYGLAFLWVDDPIAAFFLQIQGSGRVRLRDGSEVRVGFAGANGWPYVAIGRLLVERGILAPEEVSLPAIRAWLEAHPAAGRALMDENPSYVFFREIAGDGPVGSEGVVLTPGRSLAVDADFIPLGVPVWLDARQGDERLRRLLVAQDTGAAIRGPLRGDVFWGFGHAAALQAGKMRARGIYVILLPRRAAAPAAADAR